LRGDFQYSLEEASNSVGVFSELALEAVYDPVELIDAVA
jgi:hypothetical protein